MYTIAAMAAAAAASTGRLDLTAHTNSAPGPMIVDSATSRRKAADMIAAITSRISGQDLNVTDSQLCLSESLKWDVKPSGPKLT
jgi:hypothetical protein